jgi:deoxyribonuclease-4
VSSSPKNTSPRIGAHTSIAGSLVNAAHEAADLGCNTFQIFTRSPRMWHSAPLDANQVAEFKDARAQFELGPLVIHGNYLTNMASCNSAIRGLSIEAFRDEVERALLVGADYLVIHPGSSKGHTLNEAMTTLASSIARAVDGMRWNGLRLLLENTAGGGQTMGRDFEELAEIRSLIEQQASVPVGYCIDTAHCYEAGFDIATAAGLEETLAKIEGTLGLANIPVIHTNDSRTALVSRCDRHEHICAGNIGGEGFRRILHHHKLLDKAFILETPADENGTHTRNVEAIKSLLRRRPTGRR